MGHQVAHGSYPAGPRLTNSPAPALGCTLVGRRKLVAAGAAHTAGLRDKSTGQIKRLRVVLMADCWVADVKEKAACIAAMHQFIIEPVLRNADGWAPDDSCHEWPPERADAKAIELFMADRKRK